MFLSSTHDAHTKVRSTCLRAFCVLKVQFAKAANFCTKKVQFPRKLFMDAHEQGADALFILLGAIMVLAMHADLPS